MRVRFFRAIVIVAFAFSLLPARSFAEVTVNILDLRRACMAPRSFAMVEMFGANYTPEQANILDSRLEQELSGKTPRELAIAYQAFENNPQSRHPDADRYAQCIYGERLRQLDASADLRAVRRGDYVPPDSSPPANGAWGAALTRRDANTAAGSAVLAQSADPASRAARARENAALRQQAEARIAERRQQSEAFWGVVLEAAAIAAQTYVQVEAAQQQAAANPDAQSWGPAPGSQQQQQQPSAPSARPSNPQTAPCTPAGMVSLYGVPNCTGASDTASDGYANWCRSNLSYYENERVNGRDSPFVRGTIQRCRAALGLPPLAM